MAGTIIATTLGDGTNTVPTTTVIAGAAKCWVNFNGTGTIAIRDDFNVSSLTDLGVGVYRITFTSGPSTTNYCVTAIAEARAGFGDGKTNMYQTDMATTSYTQYSRYPSATNFDAPLIMSACFWN